MNEVFNGKMIEEYMVKVIVEQHYSSKVLNSIKSNSENDAFEFELIMNNQIVLNKFNQTKQTPSNYILYKISI